MALLLNSRKEVTRLAFPRVKRRKNAPQPKPMREKLRNLRQIKHLCVSDGAALIKPTDRNLRYPV
ncbi:hypothetical protein THO17_34820 [Marinomonas sp. THO17]